jgi:prepilin-type N-terminal cleavage/methylation domain-containing protein
MRHLRNRHIAASRKSQRGFTLIELLVSMAVTTVILGATMAAMTNAINATESAKQITDMNNGLRTAMDLMVRDMLQVGQGLPGGRSILVPNGANSIPIQLPGPEGSNYQFDGPSFCPPRATDPDTVCEEITAVIPGPGRGPVLVENEPASDMITTLAADSSFETVPLRAFANDGRSITVPRPGVTVVGAADPMHPSGHIISDDPDVAGDNIRAGDLIMLTKGSSSALVQVSSVTGPGVFPQVINFAANDSLNLNQAPPVADGTAGELRNTAPIDILARPPTVGAPCAPAPAPCDFVTTVATKIRMISYYIDNVTNPQRPRLVRRINNGPWDSFDNTAGTAVAFDIEGLQITYDLVDGVNNPSNVRMDDDDLAGDSAKCDTSCYPNQIRKINIMMSARSRLPRRGTQEFFRARLVTQVSLRSLAFVDRYR